MRVRISFHDSTYQYNMKLVIWPLIIMIILLFMIQVTAIDLIDVSGYYDQNKKSCAPLYPLYGVFVSGSIDFILSIVSLILFIRPLIRLNKINKINEMMSTTIDTNHDHIPNIDSKTDPPRPKSVSAVSVRDLRGCQSKSTMKLDGIIIKYALLVTMAIVSTFILHILILIWEGSTDVTSPIDNAINLWCIILINKRNTSIYNKLCRSCIVGCKKCCNME